MTANIVVRDLAPSGVLRAAINVGNTVIAGRDPVSRKPLGVSVAITRELAKRLNVSVELVVFEMPQDSVEAVSAQRAAIGFFAIDPFRARDVAFTPPYVLIEGAYLAGKECQLKHADEVDQAEVRVAVAKGTAYDLFLSRSLQSAELVAISRTREAVSQLTQDARMVLAGVKPMMEEFAEHHAGLHVLPGRFMVIPQALACHVSASEETQQYLHRLIVELRSSGFVADSLREHGVVGGVPARNDD